jgi:hypothetical protein
VSTTLPPNWFIAVDDLAGLEENRGTVGSFLIQVHRAHPTAKLRRFNMAGNRCVALLYSDTTCIVESATYWLLGVGPRPFDPRLRQSLFSANSIEDLREICASPAVQDNALLVIDKNASTLHVITGPLNITKIFCGELEGRRIVSSSIRLFPSKNLTLNPGAVASYVLNGCCVNGQTAFEEITVLERASRHEFVAGKHKAAP